MGLRPVVLLVPSMAAAVELPRRLASTGRADGRALPVQAARPGAGRGRAGAARPRARGRGTAGHDALLAARLLDERPRAGTGLRRRCSAGRRRRARWRARSRRCAWRDVRRRSSRRVAGRRRPRPEDAARLRALAELYRALPGRRRRPLRRPRHAAARPPASSVRDARWLRGRRGPDRRTTWSSSAARARVPGGAGARACPVRLLADARPPGLARALASRPGRPRARIELVAPRAERAGSARAARAARGPAAAARAAVRAAARASAVRDGSVELLTAPGEAAEVRSDRAAAAARGGARRALRGDGRAAARGREEYAPLFTDLLERLGIPHRLHPSLPLRFGRSARSLLLLLRCRGLRAAGGDGVPHLRAGPVRRAARRRSDAARPAQWDALSRDAGIVSGLERWIIGLRCARRARARGGRARARRGAPRAAAARGPPTPRRCCAWSSCSRGTLDGAGRRGVVAGVVASACRGVSTSGSAPEREREAVPSVIADLGGLGSLAARAAWREVETCSRRASSGSACRSTAGRARRRPRRARSTPWPACRSACVAVPGLVEGGYPGVLRPDPFLLDAEREALAPARRRGAGAAAARGRARGSSRCSTTSRRRRRPRRRAERRCPRRRTACSRRAGAFHRALSQATRAPDPLLPARRPAHRPRAAAVALLRGRGRRAATGGRSARRELERAGRARTRSTRSPLDDALDRVGARPHPRAHGRRGGRAAPSPPARPSSGSRTWRREARWSSAAHRLRRPGRVRPLRRDGAAPAREARSRDRAPGRSRPAASPPSRAAASSTCCSTCCASSRRWSRRSASGSTRWSAATLFHDVAERFLRERRDSGELPVRDDAETQRAPAASWPTRRSTRWWRAARRASRVLWERERARFHERCCAWLRARGRSAAREPRRPTSR